MPFVGERRHFGVGEGKELVADQGERIIQTAVFQRGPPACVHQMAGDGALDLLRAAFADQAGQGGSVQRGGIVAQVGGADRLALIHRDAAAQLRSIFGKQQLREQRLDLAKLARAFQRGSPRGHFAQRLGIGGIPAQPMHDMLLHIGGHAIDLAFGRGDASFYLRLGGGDKALRCRCRFG